MSYTRPKPILLRLEPWPFSGFIRVDTRHFGLTLASYAFSVNGHSVDVKAVYIKDEEVI